ncbi:uncharacterized protein LOC130053868 [Ostrea edulis]|uniref:uncharacterized protein LOC130053868 n=1 Tax=Ostrea edulis TaxID=37623 RepID=UPI0024AF2B37|nr:uncharacterized protein LOC130053868 [Ostrea edulis]
MLKFLRRVFGKKKRSNVECQAVVIDYDKISHSAQEMRRNNNDIHCVYQSVQENVTDVGEQLRHSEDLMDHLAKSLTDMENMAERACQILCEEKEKLQKKKDTLAKLKEDVESPGTLAKISEDVSRKMQLPACLYLCDPFHITERFPLSISFSPEDSKYRLTILRGSAVEQHAEAAESGTAESLGSFVREEREQLEHQLSVAKMDVDRYTQQNLEDEVVIDSVQLIREKLQKDHNLHVRQLQNECVNLEKKNALMKFRENHFNSNEGKTELLTFFRVPKEEQEATKKRFASLKKRKEALLEKVQGQRQRKRVLAEYNAHLKKSIKMKKDRAMLG